MKNYLLAFLLVFITTGAFAQGVTASTKVSASSNAAVLAWDVVDQNVGEIPQGTPKEVVFKFTNTGKAPLLIANVRTSCGCTASNWSREPILPGETSEIKATYNAQNIGSFTKTVTVTSNADIPSVVLRLSGTVVAQE